MFTNRRHPRIETAYKLLLIALQILGSHTQGVVQFQRCLNFQATYSGAYLVRAPLFQEVKFKAVGTLKKMAHPTGHAGDAAAAARCNLYHRHRQLQLMFILALKNNAIAPPAGALEWASRWLWIKSARGALGKDTGCAFKPAPGDEDTFSILHLSGIEHQLVSVSMAEELGTKVCVGVLCRHVLIFRQKVH